MWMHGEVELSKLRTSFPNSTVKDVCKDPQRIILWNNRVIMVCIYVTLENIDADEMFLLFKIQNHSLSR